MNYNTVASDEMIHTDSHLFTLNDDTSKLVEKQGRKAKGLRSMTMTAGCRI